MTSKNQRLPALTIILIIQQFLNSQKHIIEFSQIYAKTMKDSNSSDDSNFKKGAKFTDQDRLNLTSKFVNDKFK